MRYHVKGGIWKNTEDEIMKAAVMKYGLNQWSRISSLLVRKSAKQCKERWYEWLDPQIKKTEWTKDEEEKLLHLAKMFPCQWRTIAPIVGRTAYQCMEHYEKLLDRAQGRDTDDNDPRQLRPGEIDPNPETKPARPDPIDMAEDEKEMLNEARARLANTRGKKAKRKAREKQLEEARRLAALQKKRELKSAGIDVVLRLPRKKKKEMNYNIDIPFLRKVPDGSFQKELEKTPAVSKFKGAISLQFLENRNRDEEEEKFRKVDAKRMKNLTQKNLPEAIELVNRLNDPTNILQRNKLMMPEPMVNESDLRGISKLTSAMGGNNELIGNRSGIEEYGATNVLMGEYSVNRAGNINTGLISLNNRTPKTEDNVMREARIAASLIQSQTPLIGGEYAEEDLQNFRNYQNTEKPISKLFKTPAPMNISLEPDNLTKLTDNSFSSRGGKTPIRLRDEMNINMDDQGWENTKHTNNQLSDTNSSKPKNIKSLLLNLPKPQNKYEIDMTDNTENIKQQVIIEEMNEKIVEDSEDKLNREKNEKVEKDNLEFLHQTKVVQRNLPRPYELNQNYRSYYEIKMTVNETEVEDEENEIKKMGEEYIRDEMLNLAYYDSINHPIKGQKLCGDFKNDIEMSMEEYTLEEKKNAGDMIEAEMKKLIPAYDGNFNQNWSDVKEKEIFYIPDMQMFFHVDDIQKSKKYESLQETFNNEKSILTKEINISKKLEEKATVLTKGFVNRYGVLSNKFSVLVDQIEELEIKHKIYENLKIQEDLSIIKRQRDIENCVNSLKNKEVDLQSKYKKYMQRISELENL